jgi:hypothetical protein
MFELISVYVTLITLTLYIYYLMCRLQDRNMTAKDAYQYFVLKAQEVAISKNWTPVNWYVLIYVNDVVCYVNLIFLLYCLCVCVSIYIYMGSFLDLLQSLESSRISA